MNIPEVDQKLAMIKVMHVQIVNGLHVSDTDYDKFIEAVSFVAELSEKVARRRDQESK